MRRLADIARHREALSARAAAQRVAVAAQLQQLSSPAGKVDRLLGVAQFVRTHPLLFGAGVAAIFAMARGTLFRVLPAIGRALAAWRMLRVAGAWWVERQRGKEIVTR